jgi:hypothetical protein
MFYFLNVLDGVFVICVSQSRTAYDGAIIIIDSGYERK